VAAQHGGCRGNGGGYQDVTAGRLVGTCSRMSGDLDGCFSGAEEPGIEGAVGGFGSYFGYVAVRPKDPVSGVIRDGARAVINFR
jgi:hypothetical protein